MVCATRKRDDAVRAGMLLWTLAAVSLLSACRWQAINGTTVSTDQNGSGTGTFTAQCSGDFPDWISSNPPPSTGDVNSQEPGVQKSFQLAQSYPLGDPVFSSAAGGLPHLDHWNPPAANVDAPWRTFTNLADSSQRTGYLNSIRSYLLQTMSDPGIDFDATKNNIIADARRWFHVPMMTAAATRRREPYHGVTSERGLRSSEQTHWLTAGPNVKAVAVGYYNSLGGYTIGQVFKSYDLSKTDPSMGHFIDGTFVFKLLFAQYDPSRIVGTDPLLHSPAWYVQDPSNPSAAPMQVRLLQVDVAVKDDHFSSTTGWVFATFVYDESMASTEPNPWRRLTPIGLQWGNDPTVTGTTITPLAQTWINPSMPGAFLDHLGRAGRLVGPIDNPASSCLSCHSTAEVDMGKIGDATGILGAALVPPTSCSDPMDWFRNLGSGAAGSVAFGRAVSACPVDTSTAGLTPLDYSLQLQEGIQAVYGFRNENPCAATAKAYHDASGDAESLAAMSMMRDMKVRPEQRFYSEAAALRIAPAAISRVPTARPPPSSSVPDPGLHER